MRLLGQVLRQLHTTPEETSGERGGASLAQTVRGRYDYHRQRQRLRQCQFTLWQDAEVAQQLRRHLVAERRVRVEPRRSPSLESRQTVAHVAAEEGDTFVVERRGGHAALSELSVLHVRQGRDGRPQASPRHREDDPVVSALRLYTAKGRERWRAHQATFHEALQAGVLSHHRAVDADNEEGHVEREGGEAKGCRVTF